MTIASVQARYQFSGNGASLGFSFAPPFVAPADLQVSVLDSTGAAVASVLNGAGTYDYSVVGTLDPATGQYLAGATVTFNTAPPSGYTVTLFRTPSPTQSLALSTSAAFPPKRIETELDKLTMVDQALSDGLARAIAAPVTDPVPAPVMTLPAVAVRAGAILGFDSTGRPATAGNLAILASLLAGGWTPSLAAITWVPTIAGLRALVAPGAAALVSLSGYSVAGDKPTVAYLYNTTDTRADDGGGVIKPAGVAGGSPGRWNLVSRDPYFITDWGADTTGAASCNAAIAAAGAYARSLYFPAGVYSITANLTITADVALGEGASFTIANGVVLTLKGALTAAPRQIFTGAGSVSFIRGGPQVYPEWWGAAADGLVHCSAAFNAADAACPVGGLIQALDGVYLLDTTVTLNHCKLQGTGGGTVFKPLNNATSVCFQWNGANLMGLANFTMDASAFVPTICNVTAIRVGNASLTAGIATIENLYIYGFGIGIDNVNANALDTKFIRIQNCHLCVQVGGLANHFVGDCKWDELVLIPALWNPALNGGLGAWDSAQGYGIVIDSGANAMYFRRIEIIGGYIGVQVQLTSGLPAQRPDNIWFFDCNIDIATSRCVSLLSGWHVNFLNTWIGGCVSGPGLAIEPVTYSGVEGVTLVGCSVGGNGLDGIIWTSGRNLVLQGTKIWSNSVLTPNVCAGVHVQLNASGLFHMTGCMSGLSAAGETGFGNILQSQAIAVALDNNCLADQAANPDGGGMPAPAAKGRVMIVGNMLGGNTTAAIADASLPSGTHKLIANNITA